MPGQTGGMRRRINLNGFLITLLLFPASERILADAAKKYIIPHFEAAWKVAVFREQEVKPGSRPMKRAIRVVKH